MARIARVIATGYPHHLLELLRYIHRNPVRANICNAVSHYPWSSHQGYISSSIKWDWLHKQFLLGIFAGEPNMAKRQYQDFVQGEDSTEITAFFSNKNPASFFGSLNFIEWVKSTYHLLQQHEEIPQSRQLTPTIVEIKRIVCQCYKIENMRLE